MWWEILGIGPSISIPTEVKQSASIWDGKMIDPTLTLPHLFFWKKKHTLTSSEWYFWKSNMAGFCFLHLFPHGKKTNLSESTSWFPRETSFIVPTKLKYLCLFTMMLVPGFQINFLNPKFWWYSWGHKVSEALKISYTQKSRILVGPNAGGWLIPKNPRQNEELHKELPRTPHQDDFFPFPPFRKGMNFPSMMWNYVHFPPAKKTISNVFQW